MNIYFIGDSLFARRNTWPKYLQALGWAHTQVTALGGLKLVDFDLFDWLHNMDDWKATAKPDRICVGLGTNDALKNENLNNVATSAAALMTELQATRIPCDVILPPTYPNLSTDTQDAMIAVRTLITDAAQGAPTIAVRDFRYSYAPQHMDDDFHFTGSQNAHLCRVARDWWGLDDTGA